jgi:hypothetical protein
MEAATPDRMRRVIISATNLIVADHYHLVRDAVLSTGGILEVNLAASCGTYRVIVRHGVSRVRSGQRQTLGLIRDAR